jgi:hypothetical protein
MFKRFFDRLREDVSIQRAETIREWVEHQPGVTLISAVAPRSVAKVAGVVDVMRVRPRQGVQAFEADVTDGTGTVTAVWLGRSTVPGVSIGARIVLEGRFGGDRTNLHVINPAFEFASPGH